MCDCVRVVNYGESHSLGSWKCMISMGTKWRVKQKMLDAQWNQNMAGMYILTWNVSFKRHQSIDKYRQYKISRFVSYIRQDYK